MFVNCPFDPAYLPIFRAIIFAIHELGFDPRCALEVDDASETRLHKIVRIISECAYGIHDLSAVSLSRSTNLPRFNMPLELGIFLGCKFYGSPPLNEKICLILDSDPYRYRASVSDLSGQDIHCHHGEPAQAIIEVRNWLAAASRAPRLPGGANLVARYDAFQSNLPRLCKRLHRQPGELTHMDYSEIVERWLRKKRRGAPKHEHL